MMCRLGGMLDLDPARCLEDSLLQLLPCLHLVYNQPLIEPDHIELVNKHIRQLIQSEIHQPVQESLQQKLASQLPVELLSMAVRGSTFILLEGPSCCGKTHIIRQLLRNLDHETYKPTKGKLLVLTVTPETEEKDLVRVLHVLR